MKQVTVLTTIEVTEVIKVPDDRIDEYITSSKSVEEQRETAKLYKKQLEVDDVQVRKVKLFVKDIKRSKKK